MKLGSHGQFLGTMATAAPPIGVAVSSAGTVAVSLGDSVILLNQSGTKTGQLGSGAGEFGIATGIAFDDTGNIYVTDGIRNCVPPTPLPAPSSPVSALPAAATASSRCRPR